jgi:drug/metabolite transporter (DMT)-like permease
LKNSNILLLVLLAAIWGASYLFIRIAAPVLGSFFTMGLRVAIAAIALMVYGLAIRRMPNFQRDWKKFLIIGLLNNAVPFVLIVNAVTSLNASIGATLNATTPLFTAVVAAIWVGEALTARKLVGVSLGVVGVAVLMGWNAIPFSTSVALGAGQALLAALSYGLAAVYVRTCFKGVPAIHIAIGQLLGSTLLLAPLAVLNVPQFGITTPVILAVVAMGLVCTALAYLIYFRLIASSGATQAASVTFLIPIFSILWGALFLREPLSFGLAGGVVVILFSVWLVLGARSQPGFNKTPVVSRKHL